MRTFLAKYLLANGARGTLHVIASDSCSAVMQVLDLFDERVRTCSVRPA